MSKMRLAFMAALIPFLWADSTSACICVTTEKPLSDKQYRQLISSEYQKAASVFSAIVTGFEPTNVKLKVGKVWKGEIPDKIAMFYVGTSCDYGFKTGEKYLIYAYHDEHGLGTSVCSLTKRIAEVRRGELKSLGVLSRKKGAQERREKVRQNRRRNLTAP